MVTAVILAGGLGTRLRSAVPDHPKPMAPLNGRPFLEYLLDYWAGQGVEHFILSVGYLREQIIRHFGGHYRSAHIDYVSEESPLGTGGALLQATQTIAPEEYFLMLNGDTFFAVSLPQLQAYAHENQTDCCFSLFRANEVDRYMSIELATNGSITNLKSGRSVVGSFANGGVYYMKRSALMEEHYPRGQKLSFEDEILPTAQAAQRRLYGKEFAGTFIDIGVPEDYRRAAQILC